jgi:hypothetical protein
MERRSIYRPTQSVRDDYLMQGLPNEEGTWTNTVFKHFQLVSQTSRLHNHKYIPKHLIASNTRKKTVEVKTLYRAIRNDWQLHQYLFSSGGSGRHFWKYVHACIFEIYLLSLTYWSYTLLQKMADDPNRFLLPPEVPANAWSVFSECLLEVVFSYW